MEQVDGQLATQLEGQVHARALQTKGTALEMVPSRTGDAQVVISCVGAEFSTEGIETGQGSRGRRLRPLCLDGHTGSLELGQQGLQGPQTVLLAGQGPGGTGHMARTCDQVPSPALLGPCCTGWQALTLGGLGCSICATRCLDCGVAQEAGPMGEKRGGLGSGRGSLWCD